MTAMAAAPAPAGRLKSHALLILRLLGFLLVFGLLMGPVIGLAMPVLSKQLPEPALRLFGDGVISVALVVATAVFARWIDRRPVCAFALTRRRLGRHILAGGAIGLVMTGAVAAVLLATGVARPGALVVTGWSALGFAALASLVNCFAQEFLLRGYLLMAMARAWGSVAAVLITAAVFAAIHPPVWAGTSQGLLLAADIFGAGLLLGACVLLTRSVWLAVGLHFAWNFAQPIVFGPEALYWPFEGVKGALVALPPGRILEADPASFAGLAVGGAIVLLAWRRRPRLQREYQKMQAEGAQCA